MHAPRQPPTVSYLFNNTVCFLFCFCLILFCFCLEISDALSSIILVPLTTYISLYGEYVVWFSLPDGVFLPCDHELDFFTSAFYVRQII